MVGSNTICEFMTESCPDNCDDALSASTLAGDNIRRVTAVFFGLCRGYDTIRRLLVYANITCQRAESDMIKPCRAVYNNTALDRTSGVRSNGLCPIQPVQ